MVEVTRLSESQSTGVEVPSGQSSRAEPVDPGAAVEAVTEEDCRWAYQHFGSSAVDVEEAPSAGAWGLLHQMRKDPGTYRVVFDRLAPKQFRVVDPGAEECIELTGVDDLIRREWRRTRDVIRALE